MSNETKRDVFNEAANELEDVLPDTAMFGSEYIANLVGELRARYTAALPDNLPVISASVAEFIVWCKGQNTPLQDALYFESDGFMHSKQDEERIGGWITDHQDEFARAWLDGYEIDNKS